MKKLILPLIILTLFLLKPGPAQADVVAGSSALPKNRLVEKELDPRVEKLASFLNQYNSILAKYADCFIRTADKYGLEEYELTYLVPAITGLESSFAKRYPQDSHNAYGWASGAWYWDSWEESIEHVTRVLRTKYIDRGATTVARIGPIYAESPTWAQRVSFFIEKIKNHNPLEAKLALTL
jgi:hypothetical protein